VFAERQQSEDFRAQPQLDALLRGLRRGVRTPFERLPTVGGPHEYTVLVCVDAVCHGYMLSET